MTPDAGLVAACVAGGLSDVRPTLVLADWCDDHDMHWHAVALRHMAAYVRWPHVNATRSLWSWTCHPLTGHHPNSALGWPVWHSCVKRQYVYMTRHQTWWDAVCWLARGMHVQSLAGDTSKSIRE